jgi:hypothetical protein
LGFFFQIIWQFSYNGLCSGFVTLNTFKFADQTKKYIFECRW